MFRTQTRRLFNGRASAFRSCRVSLSASNDVKNMWQLHLSLRGFLISSSNDNTRLIYDEVEDPRRTNDAALLVVNFFRLTSTGFNFSSFISKFDIGQRFSVSISISKYVEWIKFLVRSRRRDTSLNYLIKNYVDLIHRTRSVGSWKDSTNAYIYSRYAACFRLSAVISSLLVSEIKVRRCVWFKASLS